MRPRFEVTLQGGEVSDGVTMYEPGGRVSGTVEVEAEDICRHLWVRLIWHTEGRGNEDIGKIDEVDIYRGRLRPGSPIRSNFFFQLPNQPHSYAGHYVNVVWAVEVQIDLWLGRDPVHRHRFIMMPRPAG